MSEDLMSGLDQDLFRSRFIKYTRRAFLMLPRIENPRILDVGCGSGVPTIELASLCKGQIIGVDIDQTLLERLDRKIREAGLQNRVKTVVCSLFELDSLEEEFDVIWAEGSISIIGFGRGIREWKRLLRPGGFMVVHDEAKNVSRKLREIDDHGYKLLGSFRLPGEVWLTEYYVPLEKRIKELREKFQDDPKILKILEKHQDEIDMVRESPEDYASIFFILRK
jgi:ubiquinone/menaquinone biosynthesis C-methylase UbiE